MCSSLFPKHPHYNDIVIQSVCVDSSSQCKELSYTGFTKDNMMVEDDIATENLEEIEGEQNEDTNGVDSKTDEVEDNQAVEPEIQCEKVEELDPDQEIEICFLQSVASVSDVADLLVVLL
eukprot:581515_1